ncbi:DUF2020 domain-containing protein [Corynebacterium sp. A21]|uniref:DUF2020 domain-containing protein n=1 Tax=Corynebacterium sp. A21 TaxID=3457318 RepID=UPI003FD3A8B9
MARTLPTTVLMLSAALLAGCAPSPGTTLIDAATTTPAPPAPGLPHDATPEIPAGRNGWVECPYLDTEWVAETNGQKVTGVGVDDRFSTPACVFWSYPAEPQLSVMVREMPDETAAIAVVDWAAPIDTTEPAEEIPGWSGGRAGAGIGGHEDARYAVQKDHWAVVVNSNQEQSLKAELIAREVIANLGL